MRDILNDLRDYFNLVYPIKLQGNEFIRIVMIDSGDKARCKYINTFDEFIEVVERHKNNWNLFATISTVRGRRSAKTEDMLTRQVLFVDVDKKDFPEYKDYEDFAKHISERLNLFCHMVVDSGNGYHLYYAIEPTTNTEEVTEINRRIIKVLGADEKAGSPTQIMRIPTTFNLKDLSQPKLVNMFVNSLDNGNFKPHKLSYVKRVLRDAERKAKKQEDCQGRLQALVKRSSKQCIGKMLVEGAPKGHRNFCLGYIATDFKQKGFNYEKAKELIVAWNEKCNPPKNEAEAIADFDRFWNTDYKFGCKPSNKREQEILACYCDYSTCAYLADGRIKAVDGTNSFPVLNNLLDNSKMRSLSGNDYLILCLLCEYKSGLTKKQIKDEITDKETSKQCMSDKLLNAILINLVYKYGLIVYDGGCYCIMPPHGNAGYIRSTHKLADLLICKIIKPSDYKLYLCLTRNLQQGKRKAKSVTYEQLADDLSISTGNVGDHIKALEEAGALEIAQWPTENGYAYNHYTLLV